MVREYPALVITDALDLSKNSGNPAFAHPNLCPATHGVLVAVPTGNTTVVVTIRSAVTLATLVTLTTSLIIHVSCGTLE